MLLGFRSSLLNLNFNQAKKESLGGRARSHSDRGP